MVDERTARIGAWWRRCEPALARQLTAVHRTVHETGDDVDAWRAVWGPFLVSMAAQVDAGRPLTKRQSNAATRALRDAHRRRWARFPDSTDLLRSLAR